MARMGYMGEPIARPGASLPSRIGSLTVSAIPRQAGLGAHVANVKRQNIVLDAAVIVARLHGFVAPPTTVGLSGARHQHFGATGGQHAAHAVKRYLFNNKDIIEVYGQKSVDEVALIGLRTMLGLVTDVDRRANLSIDKRLETNPKRVAQLQFAVDSTIHGLKEAREMAREFEFQRRFFEKAMLHSLRGGFNDDARYGAMLMDYEAALAAPPPADEAPGAMVDMIERLIG